MYFYPILGFLLRPHMITCKNTVRRSSVYMNDTLIHSLEPPSGGKLKLLTHLSADSWAFNWIMYIASEDTEEYDEHFYMDYFNMRGIASIYTSPDYFYLGYFPDRIIKDRGPKYVGIFKVENKERRFVSKLIMENPYYIDENSSLLNFKNEVIKLTQIAGVEFCMEELIKPEQLRYYYSWKYE